MNEQNNNVGNGGGTGVPNTNSTNMQFDSGNVIGGNSGVGTLSNELNNNSVVGNADLSFELPPVNAQSINMESMNGGIANNVSNIETTTAMNNQTNVDYNNASNVAMNALNNPSVTSQTNSDVNNFDNVVTNSVNNSSFNTQTTTNNNSLNSNVNNEVEMAPVVSVGKFLGYMLLPMIPVVGWIVWLVMMIVKALDKKDKSMSNYAKAQLILFAIGFVLICGFVLFFVNFFADYIKEEFAQIPNNMIEENYDYNDEDIPYFDDETIDKGNVDGSITNDNIITDDSIIEDNSIIDDSIVDDNGVSETTDM